MSINDRPVQLRSLRTALAVLDGCIRDADQWAEQAADVWRLDNPEYADLIGRLRDELSAARNDHEMGTPATVARVVAELLGESG